MSKKPSSDKFKRKLQQTGLFMTILPLAACGGGGDDNITTGSGADSIGGDVGSDVINS